MKDRFKQTKGLEAVRKDTDVWIASRLVIFSHGVYH